MKQKGYKNLCYKDTKWDTKYRKWVLCSSYGSLKVTGISAIKHTANEFLLLFHSYYVPILHHF